MELFRADDAFFQKFGQVYLTTAYPGVVKGWHYHKKRADNMAVVKGMMKIVLYDSREDSPTHGQIKEIFTGIHNPVLVHIPPRVYHGFKCISDEEALGINTPTKVYNYDTPDEHRLPAHGIEIP